jgi:hypothetical protein
VPVNVHELLIVYVHGHGHVYVERRAILGNVVRALDLTSPIEPVFDVRFRFGGQSFGFLTTLTCFNAPQDVTLDELRIESYFPLDDATARLCEQMVKNS